ncbi:lipoprotein-releasing system permease protein [Thermotomaculum hydrothermale]|uniref:Lipoprotein-releasing system permease protein n=1 Tax=Thermotomaculum hydrothermale TaxID=981385 RepID=A0A7R6SYW3_9BACT|nr:FtsX-like permease family protein [Thermotomaculum hydrothermale]BBB32147.1 lipoprotein-releasing system permease protein [Thermotomaculum hydrothermale]
MKAETFIALRYLKAKRHQTFIGIITIISVLGIIIGTFSLIIALSLMTGFHNKMKENLLDANSHLSVHSLSDTMEIKEAEEIIKKASKLHYFKAGSYAVLTQGLLRGGLSSESKPVVVKGVLLNEEKKVTTILDSINLKTIPLNGVVIGEELAKRQGLTIGDKVTVLFFKPTQTPLGIMPRIRTYTVSGIFSSGIYEYDKNWVFVNLKNLQSVLNLKNKVDFVQFRCSSIDKIDKFKSELKKVLSPKFFIIDLRDTNKKLFAAIKIEKIIVSLIIGLIVLVAALNITSSLILMVMEKRKDIGILKAMGMKNKQIMKIFKFQGIVIGFVGSFLGCSLGVITAYFGNKYQLIKLPPDVYDFLSFIPFDVRFTDVALVFLCTVLITYLATIYPAKRAAELDPAKAVRYE